MLEQIEKTKLARNPAVYRPKQTSGILEESYFTDIDLLPPSIVVGIFGNKGDGKSLLAALLAEWDRNRTGMPILYFPESYAHIHGEPISLQEMALGSDRMNRAILIWDEAQVLLNKYRSASTGNRALIAFLTQVRKRGATLIYTSNAPKQLDRALGEQTDLHVYCTKKTDPRCAKFKDEKGRRRHLRDCQDHLKLLWVDTQGTHGVNWSARDRRIRAPGFVPNITEHYSLYNTLASVQQHEVDAISRESLDEAREDISSGMSAQEFRDQLSTWIVDLLSKADPKPTRIIASQFAKTIEEETGLKVSANRVSRACKDLGLTHERNAKGRWFNMPDPDTLHLWARGLA